MIANPPKAVTEAVEMLAARIHDYCACLENRLSQKLIDEAHARIAPARADLLDLWQGEPVAWRVKDFADGWFTVDNLVSADACEVNGARVEPLYLHPSPSPSDALAMREAAERQGLLYVTDAELRELLSRAPAMREAAATKVRSFGDPWKVDVATSAMVFVTCVEKMAKAIEALPLPSGEAERTAKRWRHVKRGTSYTEIGRGELQCSGYFSDGSAMVLYRGDDGKFWCRPVAQFDDGLFEPLLSAKIAQEAET